MAGPGAHLRRPQQVPPAALQRLLVGIGAAIDAAGGGFAMHYTAAAVTAARGTA